MAARNAFNFKRLTVAFVVGGGLIALATFATSRFPGNAPSSQVGLGALSLAVLAGLFFLVRREIVEASAGLHQILGLPEREDTPLLRSDIYALIQPDDVEKTRVMLQRTIEGKDPGFEFVARLNIKGETRHFLSKGSLSAPHADAERGTLTNKKYLTTVVKDVTDFIETRDQLELVRQRLVQMDVSAKTIASFKHEINTPLASIITLSDPEYDGLDAKRLSDIQEAAWQIATFLKKMDDVIKANLATDSKP